MWMKSHPKKKKTFGQAEPTHSLPQEILLAKRPSHDSSQFWNKKKKKKFWKQEEATLVYKKERLFLPSQPATPS